MDTGQVIFYWTNLLDFGYDIEELDNYSLELLEDTWRDEMDKRTICKSYILKNKSTWDELNEASLMFDEVLDRDKVETMDRYSGSMIGSSQREIGYQFKNIEDKQKYLPIFYTYFSNFKEKVA